MRKADVIEYYGSNRKVAETLAYQCNMSNSGKPEYLSVWRIG